MGWICLGKITNILHCRTVSSGDLCIVQIGCHRQQISRKMTEFSHIPMHKRSSNTSMSAKSNRSYIAAHVGLALLYSRQSTRDVWRHDVPNYRMKSVFDDWDVGLCNSNSKVQTSIAHLFVNKNIKCGYTFSWLEQKEHFGTNLLCLCWHRLFRSFNSDISMFEQRGVIRKHICLWYLRKRIDHWCSVGKENSQPSGSPIQSSGKRGWIGGPES